MSEPKPYDLGDMGELKRWFREMEGYLRVSRFTVDGTDRQGRKYAMEAFHQLREICMGEEEAGA